MSELAGPALTAGNCQRREKGVDTMENHSLNLTDLLARINMQARLVGGPCEDAPVLLPPMLYGEPPEFVCASRPYDSTFYHYVHRDGLTYEYKDHCDTYAPWPHHPWDPELSNKSRERTLFAGLGVVILAAGSVLSIMVGLAAYNAIF